MAPQDVYTHGHHHSVLRSHTARTAENSAGYLLPRLTPGQRLADIGCGPGTITLDLADRVAPGEVVGIDRSSEIIEQAERLRVDREVANARFEVGDVYELACEDASFDVVNAHQVLQHLSDPVAALREMRRVCRPGGVVAARDADYRAMTWSPGDDRLDRWMGLYQAVARSNGAEPDAGRHLLRWARAAGFSVTEPGASVWCFATPADREWWGGLWADRVVSSALAGQAIALGLADPGELDDLAAGWRRWADQPDGWFAVLHGEILCTP